MDQGTGEQFLQEFSERTAELIVTAVSVMCPKRFRPFCPGCPSVNCTKQKERRRDCWPRTNQFRKMFGDLPVKV